MPVHHCEPHVWTEPEALSMQEVEVLHLVSDHPNIAELKVAYEDSAAVHLVLEMCKGGELFDRQAPAAGCCLSIGRCPLSSSAGAQGPVKPARCCTILAACLPAPTLPARAAEEAICCSIPFTCWWSSCTCPVGGAGQCVMLALDHLLPAARRIVAKGNLTERQAADYFRTMVTVAAHCHQLGVMHRWGGLRASPVGQHGL